LQIIIFSRESYIRPNKLEFRLADSAQASSAASLALRRKIFADEQARQIEKLRLKLGLRLLLDQRNRFDSGPVASLGVNGESQINLSIGH
jgi:hypothetical protein